MNTACRRLFTDFLKSRRARLAPNLIGVENMGRRRTKGLRRSEIAQLAGVSTEWYTLFETGHERALTDRMLNTISPALRLNPAEHDYLRDLMREPIARISEQMHPSIEFAVRNIKAVAVCIYDPWLNQIANNRVTSNLLLIHDDPDPMARNLLWRFFARPWMRALLGSGWKKHAQRHVGLLRRSLARDPSNEEAHKIIDRLTGIPEFDEAWQSNDVYSLRMYNEDNAAKPYHIYHPLHGKLAVHLLSKPISSWPGGHMTWLTPGDERSVAAFKLFESAA